MLNNIETKILDFANSDSRIRAVILNGSRANPNVTKDEFQDYDLMLIVDDFDSFIQNRDWILSFGKPILQQIPDEMNLGNENKEEKYSFTFLTYFEDGNRLDISFFPKEKFENHFKSDSLSVIWMDKDNLFENLEESSDKDYHITKPTQQEFSEVCNEFWWCVTNVAKGLKRNEILYTKDMMENVVRPMFLKMIEWKIGFLHDYKISMGKSGKFITKFVDADFYNSILETYSDSNTENNWKALFQMLNIFREEQRLLSKQLDLINNTEEAENSTKIIEQIRKK